MKFNIIGLKENPPDEALNEVFLRIDHWNDYSFVTMFYVWLFDENGQKHELGNIKIGFQDQKESQYTYKQLTTPFSAIPKTFFSLGTDYEYYSKLGNEVSKETSHKYLSALNDIVFDKANLETASGQEVFKTSLLRGVSMSVIEGQFNRVLKGEIPLTDFKFSFTRPDEKKYAGVDLKFNVKASSKPSTNIHAIIGRNGVGKTSLLNDMIDAIVDPEEAPGGFYTTSLFELQKISPTYFSSLVSISFSAFDPFSPPPDQLDPELGPCYYYIGLKDIEDETGSLLKTLKDLHEEFIGSLEECLHHSRKSKVWLEAISTLESDTNFSDMMLAKLIELNGDELRNRVFSLFDRMSSGHAIVLITITKLVAKVEEKTLVLIDEPESHLHPPLLSAFTRAISELLYNRNGLAIIATHSPVVLQEIPKTCVWKMTRSRLSLSTTRPDIETFGENVGILTREIFGLEVSRSGFHTVLEGDVANGGSYDEILDNFKGQLGYEARAILRAMVTARDKEQIPE